MYSVKLQFHAIQELEPGAKVQGLFQRYWPAYRRWFLKEGEAARPSYARSLRLLRRHMPELVPTYERLVELAGGGDTAARFLALYCPPPLFSGCSQAVWTRHPVALVRNYDYPLHLFDGVLLYSAWNGTRVIATSDCLWGVLDGMNEHGLAVSLAFGGRRVAGEGFGITLVLRYILETCRTAREANAVLCRIPVQTAYNVAVLDAGGDYATVCIAPDRAPVVTQTPVSANRQGSIDWPEFEREWQSVRREAILKACLDDPQETLNGLKRRFLQPPVYRASHPNGWGTLYTASYYPQAGELECSWPDALWFQSFAAFTEGERTVWYGRPN